MIIFQASVQILWSEKLGYSVAVNQITYDGVRMCGVENLFLEHAHTLGDAIMACDRAANEVVKAADKAHEPRL